MSQHPAEIYKGQKSHAEVFQAVAEVFFAEFEYYGKEYQESEKKAHEHEVEKRAYDQKQGNSRDISFSRLPDIGTRKRKELKGAQTRKQTHKSEIVHSPVVKYKKKYRYRHYGGRDSCDQVSFFLHPALPLRGIA